MCFEYYEMIKDSLKDSHSQSVIFISQGYETMTFTYVTFGYKSIHIIYENISYELGVRYFDEAVYNGVCQKIEDMFEIEIKNSATIRTQLLASIARCRTHQSRIKLVIEEGKKRLHMQSASSQYVAYTRAQ